MTSSTMSVVFVTFGTDELDLRSVPPNFPVVIVHNDDRLADQAIVCAEDQKVVHIRGHGNVGFAAAANLGLRRVTTPRVVFCNPDTTVTARHWTALAEASADELLSVPMVDHGGRPASVVNHYPTPLALVLTGYRAGRLSARGNRTRRVLGQLLGRWGAAHSGSTAPGIRPLDEFWCSGAVLSVDTERAQSVGGFDDRYFLYFEDVDFCRRLGTRFPGMTVRVASVQPALHEVGGSARTRPARATVERHLLTSAITYARVVGAAEVGVLRSLAWWGVRVALRLRATWTGRS